jgi:hypothetical protein
LNRYTYVLNNPLTHTDPSGHSIKDYWRQIAAVVITIYAPYLAGQIWGTAGVLSSTASFWVSVGTGFASGAVASGDLKGGLWGAFSAGLFFGIGAGIPGTGSGGVMGTGLNATQFASKVALHGIAGGVLQKLQGGKFGHGFMAAGVTQAFSGKIDSLDPGNQNFSPARVAAAAVLGGSVSAASGGKFANGAITGAFSRAFNDEMEAFSQDNAVRRAREATSILNAHSNGLANELFMSPAEAKDRFAEVFLSDGARLGLEFGANIISVQTPEGTRFQLSDFVISTRFGSNGIGWDAPVPGRINEDNYVALVHTHPDNSDFSPGDLDVAITRRKDSFVIRANNTTRTFNYSNYVKMGSPSLNEVYANRGKYVK